MITTNIQNKKDPLINLNFFFIKSEKLIIFMGGIKKVKNNILHQLSKSKMNNAS